MLLDGHPALSADGGEINFRALPVIDLARTEVVKGAYSALYGSNALGGVVNLITTPVDDRPTTAARAHFDAYDVPANYRWNDGLLNSQGLELQHARRLGPMGARAFVGYQGTDGYTQNGENRIWMARVKLQALPTATHQWDAFALYTNEKSQEFLTWRDDTLPFEVSPEFLGDYARDQIFLSGATVAAIATATTLLKISPFLNWNSAQNEFTANQDHHSAIKPGVNVALTRSLSPKNSFTMGGDGAYTWVSSNFIGTPQIVDAAVFVQDEARLGRNLKGEVGFRADYHDATTAQSEFVISPKIGASLRLSNSVTMRSSIGAGYRAPSAIEQFVNTFQFGFQVIPNPALQGERSWSAEIGTSAVLWNRLQIDAAVFGSRYSNLIGPAKIAVVELPLWGPFVFGAAAIFFPMSYVFGDILTEVYGYAEARKVIWAGFAALLFASLMAAIVVALPPAESARLLGEPEPRLGYSPIVSVHLLFDRRLLDEPLAALLGSPAHWVFDRGRLTGNEPGTGQYLTVVSSGAPELEALRGRQLVELIAGALVERLGPAELLWSRVSREPEATIAVRPGSEQNRPGPQTSRPNVTRAGAWTGTGWPPTMEGAVRSGVEAARALTSARQEVAA